ncbi:hypothetical protein BKA62DRAFT_706584 [Auriculariales sp. MPI-PUGE-AT-0066]|nr:hypothetical protein BKA62DRAFT_706584 [Auriculariales sp. MPI-PUGE-AT-0066]
MLWTQLALPQARIVTLDVMRKLGSDATFTSLELFEAAHKHFPKMQISKNLRPPLKGEARPRNLKEKVLLRVQPVEGVLPPYPNHPLRSVKYFKHVIMNDFERRGLIKKVHMFRDATPEEISQRNERVRNVRIFPRDASGKVTGEPPIVYKRVDEWKWHVSTKGAKELARGSGIDLSNLKQLSKADAAKQQLREIEANLGGPRLVVWPSDKIQNLDKLRTKFMRTALRGNL